MYYIKHVCDRVVMAILNLKNVNKNKCHTDNVEHISYMNNRTHIPIIEVYVLLIKNLFTTSQ